MTRTRMTPEQQDFDGLRRLLKLKRYEQPPPGYFNDFSRQVIARIKAGATVERYHALDRPFWEVPWLRRLIEAFQAKPALAVSFGAAVCSLLVGGVIYSEYVEYSRPAPVAPIAADSHPASPGTVAINPLISGGAAEPSLVTFGSSNGVNPVFQPSGSLFDLIRPLSPQSASGRPLTPPP